MLDVLQELEFTVCAFGENGGAKGFHDLLDSHGRASELVLGRAIRQLAKWSLEDDWKDDEPDEAEGTWKRRFQCLSV